MLALQRVHDGGEQLHVRARHLGGQVHREVLEVHVLVIQLNSDTLVFQKSSRKVKTLVGGLFVIFKDRQEGL